jgi:hypothetical protein
MPIYNVHLYRELKLYYPGIEADTPEAAANTASGNSTESAASIEDCDGADIAALVDLQGDEEHLHSKVIDFATVTHLPRKGGAQ